ncbi:MAG: aspartyl protease family protein [Planctomycetota bacterium]
MVSRWSRQWLRIAIFVSSVAATVCAAESREQTLTRFEAIIEAYFNVDIQALNDAYNLKIEEYNKWIEKISGAIETRQTALEKEASAIESQRALIDETKRKLDALGNPKTRDAVESYNRFVELNNAQVADYNKLIEAYQKRVKQLNDYIDTFKKEIAKRQAVLDTEKQNLKNQIDDIERFFNEKKSQQFSNEVNQFYATLRREARSERLTQRERRAIDKYIILVQIIRRKLADYTLRENARSDTPMVYAEVSFGDGVTCFLLVDTGARSITLPIEIVDALGLTDALGEETELSLAGGVIQKGRKLTLPSVTVNGHTVTDADAVVLPDNTVGIDGLLGRSFLKHFTMTIQGGPTPTLILEPVR